MELYIKFSNNQTTNIIDCNSIFGIDTSIYTLSIDTDQDLTSTPGFRVNGQIVNDTNTEFVIMADSSINIDGIFTLSVDDYTKLKDNVNISGSITLNNETHKLNLCFYTNDILNVESYDKNCNMIASNMESFMLLRTNPKLTGNIKLVVTEDYNLYLDTFKVSTTSVLNKNEYRHFPVSDNGDYAYDVYKAFKSVPNGEMYRVYDNSYKAHKPYFDLYLQIENIYEYGAEYNNDNLYSENMKILAPLYIGKHLPTYFAIFRTDRVITSDYLQADADTFKDLLKTSETVKIYDLRKSTSIGKYLNNFKDSVSKYLSGSCYLQFIEQMYDKNDVNYRQGKNTWKGIALDKGILTEKTETTYFATQTLNDPKSTQENFNMLLLNGFSRNNLLFPNIINLEFMFNDIKADNMSLHNYFGLYLTENDFITFNQVIKNISDGNVTFNYYDTDNNIVNLSDTPIDIISNPEYDDRIFFINTLSNTANATNMDVVNKFIKDNVANKPSENVLELKSTQVNFTEKQQSFLTMHFTKQISVGEHFKFITVNKHHDGITENIVLEVIASNDERLINTDDNIYPYIATNTPELLNGEDIKTKVYRLSFFANDINNPNELAPLSEQVKRLANCIYRFNNFITVESITTDSIGITSMFSNTSIQHILPDYVHDMSSVIDNEYIDDYITYFNINNTTKCYASPYIPDDYANIGIDYVVLENTGLELTHYRYFSIVDFIKPATGFTYQINYNIDELLKDIKFPIISTEEGYYPLIKYGINQLNRVDDETDDEVSVYNSITSPFNANKSLVCSPYKINRYDGYLNICKPVSCNIALMGINSIKDIDMTIDDDNNVLQQTQIYARFSENEVVSIDGRDYRLQPFITYQVVTGSIQTLPIGSNTAFFITGSDIVYIDEGNIHTNTIADMKIKFMSDTEIKLSNINLLDLYSYSIKKPVLKETNYYIDPEDPENSDLNIPIVPHVNCQWSSNGRYFDNNSLLDINNLLNPYQVTGNFIETEYSPAGNANNQYISKTISDSIYVNGKLVTIKDFILSGSTNAIKKYLISNSKIDTAIGYYNPFVQTLDFIFYGIKFAFKLANTKYTNDIKLNEYDNYEVYVINDYTGGNNEIFISTVEEFILIINHMYNGYASTSTQSIKYINNSGINNADYMWTNALYNYDLLKTYIRMSVLNDDDIIYKTAYIKKNTTQKSKSDSTIVEIDLPLYDNILSDFNEKPIYAYVKPTVTNELYDIIEIQQGDNLIIGSTNEISQLSHNNSIVSNYTITASQGESTIETIDFRQKHTYEVFSKNINDNDTISYIDRLENYIKSFDTNNIDMYIIHKDSVETYNINDTYKPIIISISIPERIDIQTNATNESYTTSYLKIKYNQGLFNPVFTDIFNFSINDNISSLIGIDTLYGNTQVTSIKKLTNYYCNKIIERNSNVTYNYFRRDSHSIFSTDWDKDIYRIYSNDTTYAFINGYQTGLSEKMFFGSKCLALQHDYIELSKWIYNNNETNTESIAISPHNINAVAQNELVLTLNLTKTFYDYICESKLYDAWSITSDISSVRTNINNYINNTLYKIYNFKDNIDIKLYKQYVALNQIESNTDGIEEQIVNYNISTASEDEEHIDINNNTNTDVHVPLYFIKEDISLGKFVLETNIKTILSEVNNEVILTINIPDYDGYVYHPVIKIFKN